MERRSPDLLNDARIPQVRCNGTSACGAEGVLLANGGAAGGYSFYVKDGKLHYTHSYVATDFFTVSSKDAVPEGWHKLRFEFEPAGEPDFAAGKGSPGFFQLHFDGTLVGSLDVPHTGFTGYNHQAGVDRRGGLRPALPRWLACRVAVMSAGSRTGRRFRRGVILAFAVGFICSAWYWRREVRSLVRNAKPYVRRRSHIQNPVLIINRWSGDGKAEAVGLEERARSVGIKTVMLERGDDLTQLAHDAIDAGADAVGMAGGDGSLGLVAAVADERDVPFFCVPVGTRNHFALDLGLDRDDPLAALEALNEGDELLIDYGLVGGRVFLNNVSLGVYAAAVHQEGYREEKAKTIAQVLAETAAKPELQHSLQFETPDGHRHERAPLVLVSNNRYVMSGPPDYGRRSRLDGGMLGVSAVTSLPEAGTVGSVTLSDLRSLHEWETSSFQIESNNEMILTGVDGEALEFPAPLDITIRPKGLRVLVPAGVRPGYLPPGEVIAARLLDMAEIGGQLNGPGDG